LVTVALKRIDLETETDAILKHLQHSHQFMQYIWARNAKKLFCCSIARGIRNQLAKIRIHPDQNI
jgi:thiazole synthase